MPIETLGSLILVGIAVTAVMALVVFPATSSSANDKGVAALLRLSGVAAVCAALSALMYVAYASQPTVVNRSIGDATMVLAPGMLWAGLRAVNGRPLIWLAITITSVGAVATAAVSLIGPSWVASGGKVLVVLIFCLLIFAETQAGRVRRAVGALVVGLMCLAYAIFSAFRIVAGFALGPASAVFQQYFGTSTTTVVTGLVIIGTTAGVISARAQLAPQRKVGASAANVEYLARAVLDQAQLLTAYVVTLPEVRLIRVAFGNGVAFRMSEAAASAIYDVVPGAMLTTSRGGDVIVAFQVGRHGARNVARRVGEAYVQRAPQPDGFDIAEINVTHTTVRSRREIAEALDAVGKRRSIFAPVHSDDSASPLIAKVVS